MGQRFESIYAVRSGFFKSVAQTEGGAEQVTGFFMTGEVIGLDGIGHSRYECDCVALEDSEVCVIPYARLDEFTREISGLQRNVHRIMSRELVRHAREHACGISAGWLFRQLASANDHSRLFFHRNCVANVQRRNRQLSWLDN
jgi:CRP-like cAMP-binding protein